MKGKGGGGRRGERVYKERKRGEEEKSIYRERGEGGEGREGKRGGWIGD